MALGLLDFEAGATAHRFGKSGVCALSTCLEPLHEWRLTPAVYLSSVRIGTQRVLHLCSSEATIVLEPLQSSKSRFQEDSFHASA